MLESKADAGSGVVEVDDGHGIVEAYVSVTGVEDSVKDVIEPGAYEKTLQNRVPKGIWSHQWSEPVSKTLAIKEILPGDSSLPDTLPNGEAWPSGAGALWVKTQFNLNTDVGRRAYENVKFFSDDTDSSAWSIGYKTTKSHKDAKGVRHIKELDLYEYSPVLHGANKHAKTLSVKSLGEAMDALEMGGYDTSAIEDDIKSAEAALPDPEGLTLGEIKQLAMARDVIDAYLAEVGAAVSEKRAAPVGDPDLEEPDEAWMDDDGHDSSDVDDEDVEVIPTLALRLEEILQPESYEELLDAADAFDEAVANLDDPAAGDAFWAFMEVFDLEEADDPEDAETWGELREIVAGALDDANFHVNGVMPDVDGEEPDDEGEDDPEAEYEDDGESDGDDALAGEVDGGAKAASGRGRGGRAKGKTRPPWMDDPEDRVDHGADEAEEDDPEDVADHGADESTEDESDDSRPGKRGRKKGLSEAEYKGISKAERDKAAASGAALSDGSFPIRNHAELNSAIKLRGQGNAPNKVVSDHIKKRARALKATHMLPEDLRDGGSDDATENSKGKPKGSGKGSGKGSAGTKSEPFTLPTLDWAERAAFAVVPEIKF